MKLKVVRVVTASYVVPWHLNNTLRRITDDFEVCVVGHDVSKNQGNYPNVKFIDIDVNRKTSIFADAVALFVLCKFFSSYKPDIVHSIMPKAGLLTALAGFFCRIPIRIHTFTGQTWVAKEGLSRYFLYLLDRLINSVNTVCLTDSFSQSNFLFEKHISYAGQPLPVLSRGSLSGVDVDRFDSIALGDRAIKLRNDLGLADDEFVFAYIARKTQAKGALDILAAFSIVSSSLNGVKLLFVGPDEDGEVGLLKKSNPKLFDNVVDVGHVEDHEVYLAIADVLCLPSYREGFGSIIIDAAAIGIPTIGTRIPGLVDSVEDGETGLLFPAGDVDALVKLMIQFIENPQVCREMGDKARTRVAEFFSADRLYGALKEFYVDRASAHFKTKSKLDCLS